MKNTMMNRAKGFTLIELMITVAIVAILAAVAMPSYQSYLQKSRRSDAIIALSGLQLAEEKFRASNQCYGASVDITLPTSTYYTIAVTAPSATTVGVGNCPPGSAAMTGYTLTATAVAGKSQASDTSCPSMTLVQTGGNTTYFDQSGMTTSTCWKK